MLVFINDIKIPARLFDLEIVSVNQWLDRLAMIVIMATVVLICAGLIWKLASYIFHRFLLKSHSKSHSKPKLKTR